MKIKNVLCIVFVGLGFMSNEQGASIVYDPTNGATMSSVLTTMKELKETSDSWKANAEFLEKVVNQGKEVKRLVALLDNLVCSTDELTLYIQIDKSFELCENRLELDMTLGKIDGISDKIKLIATGAIVLSQYETITSLKSLNDELESAVRQTASMNQYLRKRFMDRMRSEHEADNGENGFLLTTFNVAE